MLFRSYINKKSLILLHYLPFFEGLFVFHFQLLLLLLPLPSFSETVFSELQEFDESTRDAIWVAVVVVVVIVVGVGIAAEMGCMSSM